MNARSLDHLVLPTADLAVARQRLTQLGFTVAPDGVHPFGTKNACVYLADGTFIEPLAIADQSAIDEAISAGNSFVAGDQRFRASQGQEGFSAVVVSTDNAEADRAEFSRLGIAGGPMVAFSRPTQDVSGKSDIASFLLAFATPVPSTDTFFFACERRNAPRIDRSELERHENGATRILAIEAVSGDPDSAARFLAAFGRSTAAKGAGGIDVLLANTHLRVTQAMEVSTQLTTIVYGVTDITTTRSLFDQRRISYQARSTSSLEVAAAAGQGAAFVFQEIP